MSEHDFELYLTLLAKTLHLSDKQQRAIAGELRDHLEQRLDELTQQGINKHQAIQTALAEFGDASALANDFTTIRQTHTRKRIMQTTFGTIAAAAVVAFAVMTLTPTNYQGHPTQPMAGAQGDAPIDRAPGTVTMTGQGGVTITNGQATLRADTVTIGQSRLLPPPERSIHVIDCTQILVPRADGLDLLDRTASLAEAIETTVASVSPRGSNVITVQAFEEFLIVTATDEAFAKAEMLLALIGGKVQEREAIRQAENNQRTALEFERIQVQIEQTLVELRSLLLLSDEIQSDIDELANRGQFTEGEGQNHPDYLQFLREIESLQPRIEALRARHNELEQRRMQLSPFGGC